MEQCQPEDVGLDPARVDHLFSVIEKKVAEGWQSGGTFLLARHGKIAANRALGLVDPKTGRAARVDDLFCLFSTTKPITATALLRRADRGELMLTDRVAALIPEFACAGKDDVTVAQVLTHSAGFPTLPGDWTPDRWSDWDATIARICAQPIESEPGEVVQYHALTGSWILGEIVRRLDGGTRSFDEILQDEIYGPLGMKDSTLVMRDDLESRRVPVRALDSGGVPFPMEFLEMFGAPELLAAAIPGGGSYATATDLARFYQMWLNRGELDGVRLLSPAMATLATRNHTGDKHDRLLDMMFLANGLRPTPAYRGLGFFLRGTGLETNFFGSLASAGTYGHAGASSIMAWADPERDLIFVGLTAGLVHESKNVPRWHLFSDLAQACVTV